MDIPSGIGADDGTVPGRAFHADVTVTMGAPKPGLMLDPGRRHAGEVVEVPLGIEAHLPAEPALLSLRGADIVCAWSTVSAWMIMYKYNIHSITS